MEIFSIWQQSLLTAWGDLITRLILFLPVFFSAILVFVLGLVVADWLSGAFYRLLKAAQLPSVAKTAGIDDFLKKADINYDTVTLVATALRWFVVLVFFMTSANILGLTAISKVLDSLIGYLPRVISAALIVAVGVFFANLAQGLVRGALATVDHDQAKPLAKLTRWLVVVIAVMAAVNELRIAQTLVETFFQGLTWTVTLAIGLAVGLGAKDLVGQVLRDWYDHTVKK
ncbi:hypothetical protein A2634_00320 [Candidatus Amesbacteria bacterium RIFCSPHIGHO2_01_FULL_48_32]|uniref:Small-conductance mechanosensitive ion channel n=1 Tax=Candidatus Amesbacteria bacterium RIFCSPLOWO2_01_FULL_48_25 TaxID=1797259 RepID=A0A1F4ZAD2_9BACT|nr:MAG: hypothetical protein A2634_00320 [Candidatus Amesbacteria bacterium RIFCSPHIGHO2_01_FULL_48_32]OGD03253.1 MAG: hypothetical protein A2989_00270 [Candidatus Amesbacteria bacterium RIFCSPLOWO2_01_FULL_48_25]HJZ05200.1 hypothetical protein [Patescibacteria group bacterium]